MYMGQTGKTLINRYFDHKQRFLKPYIYESNLKTHAINKKRQFPNTENKKLIKSIPKGY